MKIEDGAYHSNKGFVLETRKLDEFLLKEGTKHSKEFFDVGYRTEDPDSLFLDIEEGFDLSLRCGSQEIGKTKRLFSIPMKLGRKFKRVFTTAWEENTITGSIRFVSGYVDRRFKGDYHGVRLV